MAFGIYEKLFPFATDDEFTNPSVGTAASRVLKNNPARVAWVIINTSANTGHLAWTAAVSASFGITLGPSGGNASSIWQNDFTLVTREVWALNEVAAGVWSVFETFQTGPPKV